MTCKYNWQAGRYTWPLLLSFAAGTGVVQEAQAIPAFARKYELKCSSCHVLPPKLNARGEAFRARGYRLPEEVIAALQDQTPMQKAIAAMQEQTPPQEDIAAQTRASESGGVRKIV